MRWRRCGRSFVKARFILSQALRLGEGDRGAAKRSRGGGGVPSRDSLPPSNHLENPRRHAVHVAADFSLRYVDDLPSFAAQKCLARRIIAFARPVR